MLLKISGCKPFRSEAHWLTPTGGLSLAAKMIKPINSEQHGEKCFVQTSSGLQQFLFWEFIKEKKISEYIFSV